MRSGCAHQPHVQRVPRCTHAGIDGGDDGTTDDEETSTRTLCKLLTCFPNLACLTFRKAHLCNVHARALARAFTLHPSMRLTELHLDFNMFDDESMAVLLPTLPTSMEQLFMAGMGFSDATMVTLASALPDMPRLWTFGINANRVGDEGARIVASMLPRLPQLRDVGLTLSDMTDVGCVRLAEGLRLCPHLRLAYIFMDATYRTVAATHEGREALSAAMSPRAMLVHKTTMARRLKHAA